MPAEVLAGLVVGLDHVGVAVGGLDAAAATWSRLLGLPVAHRECVDAQATEAAFLDAPAGGATTELVAPMAGNAGLARFVEKRGHALHHVAYQVTDLAEALARLAAAGVELIDRTPRPGARGHLVAFLHPRATGGVLIELVEHIAHTDGE